MYVMEFDIVAIILSLIMLFLSYAQKRIGNFRSYRFGTLLWTVFLSSILSAVSSYLINALPGISSGAVVLFTMSYYFFHNSIPVVFSLYIFSVCSVMMKGSLCKIIFFAPWIVASLLIFSNPLHSLVFAINGAGVYQPGNALAVLYLCDTLYLILLLLVVLLFKPVLSNSQRAAFLCAFILPVAAVLVQWRILGLKLECYAASMCAFFIFLTLQNNKDLVDGQTGLFTREAFTQLVRQSLNNKERFTLLIVNSRDIPGFQGLFNIQLYGKIVLSFTSWLAEAAGKNSSVCVLDDGLFAVVAGKRVTDGFAGELALSILERSRSVWEIDQVQIEIPVTIGILHYPDGDEGVADVMDRIDQFANFPEQIGNRHIFYARDLVPEKRRREAAIAYALKDVIAQGQPDLRYQPLYSVREKRIVALEVMAALVAENGETIRQGEILRIADQLGFSARLGELFLDRACEWFVRNNLGAHGISQLQVRLLESQCVELHWPDAVLGIIRKHGMDNSQLCLEITEPAVYNIGEKLKQHMEQLGAQGVKFALDDYGSGYTDLGEILEMPFSLIKLDKKIVYAGISSKKGTQLLAGSVSMFKRLDCLIAAEGIETQEQAETLSWAGCDYLQGYLFGYPLKGDAILALLNGTNTSPKFSGR